MENNIDLNETYEPNNSEIIECPFCKKKQPITAICSCGYYFDKKLYELEIDRRKTKSYIQTNIKDGEEPDETPKNIKKLESTPNKYEWMPELLAFSAGIIYISLFVKRGDVYEYHLIIVFILIVSVYNFVKTIIK